MKKSSFKFKRKYEMLKFVKCVFSTREIELPMEILIYTCILGKTRIDIIIVLYSNNIKSTF